MTNLQKRILTSIIILPLSLLFILKGGYYLLIFLLTVFFIANYEIFSVFKKTSTILFLDLMLISSLYSIYYLSDTNIRLHLLLWVIILVILSDIGGYVIGKIFKGIKLTKISPKKTVSGLLGSFIFSLLSLFIMNEIINFRSSDNSISVLQESFNFLDPKYFFLTIIFSLVAQVGDLIISYFKRLEKIKDTGKILPGHGGIFDRIDGLIFVTIITFIFYKLQIIPI